MADILVVKVNMFLRDPELNKIYDSISRQKENGLILLPPYCDAQVVPENVEIVIEDRVGHIKGEADD